MQSILDAINEWIKEILIGAINGNLSTMFGDVNEKVGTIAAEVGQTPQGWNAGIFSMIRTLSENVIVPIAGLVITYVLCYELISMVTEKNNMHDVDTSMFFKWVFKAYVAVYLVTHTFDITMAVFDMAQHVVSGAAVRDEEQLQLQSKYPGYNAHHTFHEGYKRELAAAANQIGAEGPSVKSLHTLNTLVGTLITHIRTEDKRVARHVKGG